MTEEEAVASIIAACQVLGWQFALPEVEDENQHIPGLIIGSEDYVNKVLEYLPDDLTF